MVERALSAFFLLVSLTFLYSATTGLAFGSLHSPKSGFLPTVVAAAASLLALINLLGVLRAPAAPGPDGSTLRRVGAFAAILLAYIPLLASIGYLAASFVSLFCLLKVTGTRGWVLPAAVAGGVSAGFYFTLGTLLGVVFP